MSAALTGHLEQFCFPSLAFVSSTLNSSPSLHSSISLENIRNQNDSVQTENGSRAKFHIQPGFTWHTSKVSHESKAQSWSKIVEKFSCLFFPSTSPYLLFSVTALGRGFSSQNYFQRVFFAWLQERAGKKSLIELTLLYVWINICIIYVYIHVREAF